MFSTEKYQRIRTYFNQHRVISIIAGHLAVLTVLGMVWLSTAFAPTLFGALAQPPCAKGDQTYVVRGGDTLRTIAASHATTWQTLTSYNHLANPDKIFVNQQLCIQHQGNTGVAQGIPDGNQPMNTAGLQAVHGRTNPFAYGQCTWWASQRYFQLHGFFVPWTSNSNAWQWQDRAQEFHWHVSDQPSVGAIVDLQPWVQGAQGFGHVGVVEMVLDNGHVLASNMNWGPNYSQVTNVNFHTGPGVTFISA
ncbi:COG3942 and LysM peptidoglycan-binding domain-containing protein [Dictyobacter kobayashii]|uniref:Peptidase C51 domain-containing protein n=1 Tax=Dictyobacter kobayashii TaxID=2014872 RepID=A0A402AHT4_9CHLR|nr:LysM domain-containing protein [Dictyobacter kobayashii]GCE18659.1 hypothetical protein KDK_24590 [Dictyobacter kobayashii]